MVLLKNPHGHVSSYPLDSLKPSLPFDLLNCVNGTETIKKKVGVAVIQMARDMGVRTINVVRER